MKVTMIAAMTPDRVIGNVDGGIPWSGKLPRDQQHFRDYTDGQWLVIGRTTFEEMDGWFTTQTPIVLTHDTAYLVENGHAVSRIEAAVKIARAAGAEELVVCGGAKVYEAAVDHADTLILTIVEADVGGTRFFPEWNPEAWTLVSETRFPADEANAFATRFLELRRR